MKFSTYLFEVYYLIQDFKFVIEKKICPVLKQIKYLDKGKNSSNISSCATHISSVTTPFLKRELNLELKSGWNFFFEGFFFPFLFCFEKHCFHCHGHGQLVLVHDHKVQEEVPVQRPFCYVVVERPRPRFTFQYIFSRPHLRFQSFTPSQNFRPNVGNIAVQY